MISTVLDTLDQANLYAHQLELEEDIFKSKATLVVVTSMRECWVQFLYPLTPSAWSPG